MKKAITAVLTALVVSLAFTGAAFAQGSTDEGYAAPEDTIQNQVEDQEATPVAPAQTDNDDDGGELPFTGLDLALLAGAGVMLLGMGIGMRRLTRSPESA